jgi:transposase
LLLAADGVANEEIARRCETTSDTVRRWRARFAETGVEGVGVIAPGRGRKPSVPDEVVEAIVHDTLHERPADGSTHWTTRLMAERHGVSKDTVARIWKARNLKPWRVEVFKLSNDPDFEAKLVDIVGLYLDPPERAVVLCVDEKTQTQALDRTQPSLPMKPGRGGTMTHDYKRNGTTDLFAALDVATGRVLTECRSRHTHQDFLAFLRKIDREVPKDLDVHLVLDNLSVHKHAEVKKWLASPRRKRFSRSLHPDLIIVAEPGRALVQGTDRPATATRSLRQRQDVDRRDRPVGQPLERRPQAVRLAQARRRHHRQGQARTRCPRPPHQISDEPLGRHGVRVRDECAHGVGS